MGMFNVMSINQFVEKAMKVKGRVRVQSPELLQIPEINSFISHLNLKNPSVNLGVNSRGDSCVIGGIIKDGKKVVASFAHGVNKSGEGKIIQTRIRSGKGAIRGNSYIDTARTVNADNMNVSLKSKNGRIKMDVDSDMVKGNLKANLNAKELKETPELKYIIDSYKQKLNFAGNELSNELVMAINR